MTPAGDTSVTAPVASPATVSGGVGARQTLTGQVTSIDNATGMFSLKTDTGTLSLQAPPSAVAGVKRGDVITVEIAARPTR
jgi:hypothetical protein